MWRMTAAAALALLSILTATQPHANVHALLLQREAVDASYVVQIHAARAPETLALVADAGATRSQLMTLKTGQRFECFVPLTRDALHKQQQEELLTQQQAQDALDAPGDAQARERAKQEAAFLAFGRAAAQKIRPKCIQYVDTTNRWVYEICPGVLVRKVRLGTHTSASDSESRDATVRDATASDASLDAPAVASPRADDDTQQQATTTTSDAAPQTHEVVELGQFVADVRADALAFHAFVSATTQALVDATTTTKVPLFTQVYRASNSNDEPVCVQFLCSATAVDDTVAGVAYDERASTHTATGFLVLSRAFCSAAFSDADEHARLTVPSLLQPLVDARTCVKRNEGWWTYEFCFGRSMRQYHRDAADGRVTAEFSLGVINTDGNKALAAAHKALVHEHIDATHDAARPAFVELYDHGTHCTAFDHLTPRRAKVYYYCSPGGSSHHILSVKETQTCAYAVKVSSPVLCDHPHFADDEHYRSDARRAEIVHCVPLVDGESEKSDKNKAGGGDMDEEVMPAARVQLQDAVDAATATV